MIKLVEYNEYSAIEYINKNIGITILTTEDKKEAKTIFNKIQVLRPFKDVPLDTQIFYATARKYGYNCIDCRNYKKETLSPSGLIEVIETGQLLFVLPNEGETND